MKAARFRLGACVAFALVALLAGAMQQAGAVSTSLVVSQVYGGGGNTGATLKNDFIEVFNRGGASVDVTGWSVQYGSATGSSWQVTNLSGSIPAGGHYLVQEAAGAGGTDSLPTPDATGNISMAATAGKVILSSSTTALSGTCPSGAEVVDTVGYGTTANCSETAPAPAPSNTTADLRGNIGCTDTDNNSTDFSAGTPLPRNSAVAADPCLSPGIVATATPHDQAAGGDVTLTAAVTGGTHPPSTGLAVVCDLSWVGLGSAAQLYDDGTHGDATANDLTFSLRFTIPNGTSTGERVGTCTVTDAQSRSTSAPYTVNVTEAAADEAPTVSSHTPGSGDTDVAVDANIGITFSEPVDLSDGWYSISCANSSVHTAVVTGGPSAFLLNPDTDFATGESCTVTINGNLVSDQDTNDPPDHVADTPSWSFTTVGAPQVVVSQVYGGGGNSGATLKNDFIELFNRGAAAASLNGWSVQYGSAAGTTWQVTNLTNFSLQPGQHYLVQEAQGAGGTTNLPTPDATGTINMSATAGKVALVSSTSALSGACPTGPNIVDLVGYGTTANCSETAPTGNLSNTTAAIRKGGGTTDTNNNAADFDVAAPNPHNSGTGDDAPAVISRSPASGAANVAVDSNITIGFTEPVNVSGSWFTISCGTSGSHTASVSGGPTSFTLDPDPNFAIAETCTVTVLAASVTDQDTNDPPDNMAADDSWTFSTIAPPVAIHDIQGAAHISPKVNQNVSGVHGIVTAKRSNGYYMQDPNPDSDPATSEGIFVFTSSSPTVLVGDAVSVNGRVQEFRPGGASSSNLTTTEIASPTTTVLSSGNPLPVATILGTGGRIPPSEVIEDDATGDVETSGVFDPALDGIDFYESVEGMRVQLNNAVAVGPTNAFGETPIVGDDGANAGVRTPRGGVLLRPSDGNPERVVADDAIVPMPKLNVGDHYSDPIVGVMDYNFGNFFIEVTDAVSRVDNGLQREVTETPGPDELAVATFNFENLDTTDPQSKFDKLAHEIVDNLKAPDIVAGEEVQDNNGPANDGTVDAAQTLRQLVAAISAAGGPAYGWREIDPVNNQDGGEPGGNIRQVFLFRTDRDLSFVDRPGGTSTDATAVTGTGSSTQLTFSPGRIDPTNTAWNSSRKPLAGEFLFHGTKLFVIANHFNSKGGDQPLMGHFQPPTRGSETQRHQQAHLVADFVSQLTGADPNANVVVLGDLNDFEFSETVGILKSAGLHDLMETLPENERYSYEFEGNAQVLDHILFSGALFGRPFVFDPVHVNAEFWDQASDHDPSVVRVTIAEPPTVSAGGPYTVAEGGTVTLHATGEKGRPPLAYAWDLDGNGTFETPGQSVPLAAGDGPSTATVRVRVTDAGGVTAEDEATVNVTNVAPTAQFAGPGSVVEGSPATFTFTEAQDPSAADTTAGFSYTIACDGTTFTSGSTCTFDDGPSSHTVAGRIADKDGGFTEYTAHVEVTNVAPTATFTAPASAPAGFPFTLSLSGPRDPSAADTAAGFTYAFDCGSGYGSYGSASSSSCPTSDTGAQSVGGKIRDKDGGVTEYRGTVRVFVTFSSLCDLVRAYATDPKVADDLCDKLANAEAAPTENARDGLLGAFRNQVDAKTEKGLTPAQAAELKLLSTRL